MPDLAPDKLIVPLFLVPGRDQLLPVPSLPGQFKLSLERALAEAQSAWDLGIKAVCLYNAGAVKDDGRQRADDELLADAVRLLKRSLPGLTVIADLCLCGYTRHGHCGVTNGSEVVDNDATLKLLGGRGVFLAQAGVDILMPSSMMDGAVRNLRRELDRHGFQETAIVSQAAKLDSAFYGPFRAAAHSPAAPPDKRSYQVSCANRAEILREITEDIAEGADAVMLKPALPCLDIISQAKELISAPVMTFFTSGEYGLIKAAAQARLADEHALFREALTALERAGSDSVVCYFALQLLRRQT